MQHTTVEEKVLQVLEEVSETTNLSSHLDENLFTSGLLDSLAFVELIAALATEFSINLSPAEITRELWGTPRKIITYIQERTHQANV